jgi:subtilisin family serine protease
VDPLIALGLTVHTQLLRIVTGSIDPIKLTSLIEHPNVISVDLPEPGALDLDHSIPEIHADQVWSRSGNTFTGQAGAGVVVGIIDSGIDYTHEAFINQDGSTRILYLWDQTIDPSDPDAVASESAPGNVANPSPLGTKNLNYGVEFRNNDPGNAAAPTLNKALNASNPFSIVRQRDTNSHGTHVAGIAAGSGRQGGNCHGGYHSASPLPPT